MILAAGKGSRLRPLTEKTPKPLIPVNGRPLIDYHLDRCRRGGITDIVINVSYLGQQIIDHVGDGSKWGVNVQFSREQTPLETAGGIRKALPLLGELPFWCISADIWTDLTFNGLLARLDANHYGHLVLVNNPPHHQKGDFGIASLASPSLMGVNESKNTVDTSQEVFTVTLEPPCWTYTGIALLAPKLVVECSPDQQRLGLVFRDAISQGRLTGQIHHGVWSDVGTPDRLEAIAVKCGSAST